MAYGQREDGLSLVELIISFGVVAIIASSLIFGQLQSNRMANSSRNINSSKFILRSLVDRFQSVDNTDPLLEDTTGTFVGTNLASTNLTDADSSTTGFQVRIFDEGLSSADVVMGTVERNVSVMAASGTNILLGGTFRITYTDRRTGKQIIRQQSTNRSVP